MISTTLHLSPTTNCRSTTKCQNCTIYTLTMLITYPIWSIIDQRNLQPFGKKVINQLACNTTILSRYPMQHPADSWYWEIQNRKWLSSLGTSNHIPHPFLPDETSFWVAHHCSSSPENRPRSWCWCSQRWCQPSLAKTKKKKVKRKPQTDLYCLFQNVRSKAFFKSTQVQTMVADPDPDWKLCCTWIQIRNDLASRILIRN